LLSWLSFIDDAARDLRPLEPSPAGFPSHAVRL